VSRSDALFEDRNEERQSSIMVQDCAGLCECGGGEVEVNSRGRVLEVESNSTSLKTDLKWDDCDVV
jgi:hypothetical protein